MSDEVEQCLVSKLDNIERSPFGNPIPGLSDLGIESPDILPGKRIIDLPEDTPIKARVVQINEILQVDDKQFNALSSAGIMVGSDIEVSHHNGVVQLLHKDNAVELDEDLSHAIRIEER